MQTPVKHLKFYSTPVVLVGGGKIAWEQLHLIRHHLYPIIGVDSGANALRLHDIIADVVIGDFDSITELAYLPQTTDTIKVSEQQTTDFEKALYTIDAPLFICFGFWGDRLDHCLSVLHVLTKYRGQKRVLLIDQADLIFTPQKTLEMEIGIKTRFSIYPLKTTYFLTSSGFLYSLDRLKVEAGKSISTSNETTSSRIFLKTTEKTKSNYAVILPNSKLQPVIDWLRE
jgi:thiamine pyrophosphokinase